MAIRIFAFVDDFLGGRGRSKEEAPEILAQEKGDFERSGFVFCTEKNLSGNQSNKVSILVIL